MLSAEKGGAGAQFWSVYVPFHVKGAQAVQQTLEQVDVVHRLCEKYPETLEFAWNANDLERIFAAGKVASLCGAEGGHQINDSLAVLRMFHRIGIRYMTLTHNGGPSWAAPAVDDNSNFVEDSPEAGSKLGLTDFGDEVVREMNRIGMMADLSHVHSDTMKRAIHISQAPVIMSHSCARGLSSHVRNVPDDVLKLLTANGGVCMVTFVTSFVADQHWTAGAKQGADIADVAEHIDRIKDLAGIDHVGIGGDFDGTTSLARGLEDVSKVPALTAELLTRGYTDTDIGKVLGGNVIRALRACEETSRALSKERLASEATVGEMDGQETALEQRKFRGTKRPRAPEASGPDALSALVYSNPK